ncbi:MAG: cation-transporting P-type ATPase [Planctomycetes bacterium]|nr:cation-transporting P-type ATPase [Planctomycetota bacterium]
MSAENESELQAWALEAAQVGEHLEGDLERGLLPTEVRRRLLEHGPNLLRRVERTSLWRLLLNQVKSLIILLLLAASVVSALFGEWVEATAIAAALVINGAIGFFTELRAVRSMEALSELNVVLTRVLRDGKEQTVPAQDLVPGDVLILEGGDVVTADLRLVEGSQVGADESVLTGESLPVSKHTAPLPAETLLADRQNMLHKGTALTRGYARVVVVTTGMQTELGKIAALVAEAVDQETPLEVRLERLGRRLIVVALAIATLVTVGGLLSGQDPRLTIETGIALAVAAVPEGLPVVATMALARGMWRLAQRNVLIRKLSAVETLGATTVILTDKTGTLTENRMTVTELRLGDGEALDPGAGGPQALDANPALRSALEVAALCNHATLPSEGADPSEGLGDPLEVALLRAAAQAGIRREQLLAQEPEVREDAFDPELKMMATHHEGPDGLRVAVKGAPEAVLAAATHELRAGGEVELTPERRRWWHEHDTSLAEQGLRVLALAVKRPTEPAAATYEGLTFVGLVGLQDPARAGIRASVEACRGAGIRVVMATGDQAATARTIAVAAGLTEDPEPLVLSGREIEGALNDPQQLRKVAVFARVDPAQKLSLVEAFQRAGEVVAMTGDGVNDAPALRRAEIGVAMGQRGTQVAREAADMVLRDDSFESIVVAIRQGRVIFENIRKFVLYLLSCNLAEIMVIAGASLVGLPLPLLPLQILFLNLVTDVFPALALGFGEGDPGTLHRPPRDPQEPFVTRAHWIGVAIYGAVITGSVLGALALALHGLALPPEAAVSVSFLTLGFAQLWHVFNMRQRGSSFWGNDVVRNPHVWGALAWCTLLLLTAAWIDPLAKVLGVVQIGAQGWLMVAGFSLAPWLLGQVAHACVRARPQP